MAVHGLEEMTRATKRVNSREPSSLTETNMATG